MFKAGMQRPILPTIELSLRTVSCAKIVLSKIYPMSDAGKDLFYDQIGSDLQN